MALKVSTGFKNAVLDTESVKSAFDGGFIKAYAGTVPASADAALGGATLLCTYSDSAGEDGLDLAAAAVDGVISKDSSQTWSGVAAADGTASFFRYVQTGDDGTLSTTQQRLQGTIGLAGTDMIVPTLTYTSGTTYTLNYFSLPLLGKGE